jgi:IclR family transcriptional regulator, pca regulon regulatory protein
VSGAFPVTTGEEHDPDPLTVCDDSSYNEQVAVTSGADDAGTASARPRQEIVAGLAKGLRILEAFTADTPQLSVTTAAKAAAVSPAAARRCLLTLEAQGYVSYDGKYFRPTARLARLASSYLIAAPLPQVAQPHLAAVRDAVGEATSLAVLDGRAVTFVARAEARTVFTTGIRVGSHMPAQASAAGRLFLSALPEAELDDFLRTCEYSRTAPRTLVSAEQVRERVELARSAGYSFTDEELQPGVRSIAVPVRDASGTILASMSVATLSSRHTVPVMEEEFLPVLRREADRLGSKL